MAEKRRHSRKPGACVPWEEKRAEITQLPGDEQLIRKIWEEIDSLGYLYIWHILVSF